MSIRVALRAPDPITVAGLITLLAGDPRVIVLDPAREIAADVLLTAGDPAGERTGAAAPAGTGEVRTTAPARTGAATAGERKDLPLVVIADEVTDVDVAALAERHRGVAVLPRRVATGGNLGQAVTAAAAGEVVTFGDAGTDAGFPLSGRELAVLRLVAEGYDTAEIAVRLGRSVRTVKAILRSITARERLRNRTHAVAYAIRAGVL
ncbi:LuxR C-terminal-related transcriptional regulator [Actinoplanes sp. N902-109]|uniref:helix-turn-helix transcriptional regulator n=1 Tax=Actinoplanes sp. (strain N902-109) TaxID=649831 RepID=UPI0003295257|nr:LuxR C-terminal-related transcriptional regulator [Actinoplanes sp. N902-109]AGL17140.1 LuxR family transcriptional regulator [Actinoplanes sp. N902-109]